MRSHARRPGIGFRHVIATGNESDIDTVQLIDALVDDPETRVIVAYIEGARDGRRLLEAGRRALAAGKPVLLWKAGVTKQGARAAASHTASMTGSYDFYRALFKQTGIIEVKAIHEVVDYLKVLEGGKFPAGGGVAVMGPSGGSAIVFADAGEPHGLELCELGEETRQKLAKVVPDIGAVHNPIDLTAGYFSAANKAESRQCAQGGTGRQQCPRCLHEPRDNRQSRQPRGRGSAGRKLPRRRISRSSSFHRRRSSQTRDALRVFAEARIPVLPSPERAAKAIAMLVRYRESRGRAWAERRRIDGTSAAANAPLDLPRSDGAVRHDPCPSAIPKRSSQPPAFRSRRISS